MMEHLVQSHLGGYYISDGNPDTICETCEQCGDSDSILVSWEEGNMLDTLVSYFSQVKDTEENILNCYEEGYSTEEITDDLIYEYDYDRNIINYLYDDKIINADERRILMKHISLAQKEQFILLKEICNSKEEKPKKMVYRHK